MILLRVALFPMFAAALFWLCRHFIRDDRRIRWAAFAAALPAVFAGTALVLEAGSSHDATAAIRLMVLLSVDLFLWLALGVAIYAGLLLGDQQGGYWTKEKCVGHGREAVLWCGTAIGALLLLTGTVCHFFHIHAAVSVVAGMGSVLLPILPMAAYSLGEEYVYRGCFQALWSSWLKPFRFGGFFANGIASVLFAAQHVSPVHQNALFLMALVAGLTFGAVFSRLGILAAASVHFGLNALVGVLLPHFI